MQQTINTRVCPNSFYSFINENVLLKLIGEFVGAENFSAKSTSKNLTKQQNFYFIFYS